MDTSWCPVCGPEHDDQRHESNERLKAYSDHRKELFPYTRDNIKVTCTVKNDRANMIDFDKKNKKGKVYASAKPNEKVILAFDIFNESAKYKNVDDKPRDVEIVAVELSHPQPQFVMSWNRFCNILKPKEKALQAVTVSFQAQEIGKYRMEVFFAFEKFKFSDKHSNTDKRIKDITIIINLEIIVEESKSKYVIIKSPFTKDLPEYKEKYNSKRHKPTGDYKVPKLLKILFSRSLTSNSLQILQEKYPLMKDELQKEFDVAKAIFDTGIIYDNYEIFFHYLLWWEECTARLNMKKYNMKDVKVEQYNDAYYLEVPGLAEKRPSLVRGDTIYLQTDVTYDYETKTVAFQGDITNIENCRIRISRLPKEFESIYHKDMLFGVRFMMSRMNYIRCHEAIDRLDRSGQKSRVLFSPCAHPPQADIQMKRFFNKMVQANPEQRSAVEHIVSGVSGTMPYMVHGPPGTGKTITIVEAILQVVSQNPKNRVLVCTDSNMAADHVALQLLKYQEKINVQNFLIRVNSRHREWSSLPKELEPVSNGTSIDNYEVIENEDLMKFRVVVSTLIHAAKYISDNKGCKVRVSHLFLDEAAQSWEPAALVPITGLLAARGRLVLAGDPLQLGPVCISQQAKQLGLGKSLMERLQNDYPKFYAIDPELQNSSYITVLVKNYRSDPDILALPNKLFYQNILKPMAPVDPISKKSILGLPGGDKAITFHAVNSKEQQLKNTPSFFNDKEIDMVKKYVKASLIDHQVLQTDIGIITPYIKQMYKIKSWITEENYKDIEVGTVESFQGKEKRVILVSTVRANNNMLDYDAKYNLGFLVDDKRFNVTVTRAKAKLIIIGNPACLAMDVKWELYMDMCKEYQCYHGQESEQLKRTTELLHEITHKKFDRFRINKQLRKKKKANKKEAEKQA